MGFAVTAHPSLTAIDQHGWERVNTSGYVFTSYEFLHALEVSGCVGEQTGWHSLHLCVQDEASDRLSAAMPLYIKDHSYGEYIFDHSWAHAYSRAGLEYYPKLLGAIPFTPVPGPRVLADPKIPEARGYLIKALEQITRQNHLSSAHVNFIVGEDLEAFRRAGWLIRTGLQFHWHNADYQHFDHFLDSLSSRKRKNLKKERQSLIEKGVTFLRLTGEAIKPDHLTAFYACYIATIDKKWGGAYLTKDFFVQIGAEMADKLLLILAQYEGKIIAGALNFVGHDFVGHHIAGHGHEGGVLYGRNWGCLVEMPNLHFETCYYQAIEFAIAHKIKRIEAGAQGMHKIQRGYLPVWTYSAHYIPEPRFHDAIQNFLTQETEIIKAEKNHIMQASPYKTPL